MSVTARIPTDEDVIGTADTAVMMAVLQIYVRDGRVYLDKLIELSSWSRQTVHAALRRLRDRGLIQFEDHRHGTTQPNVAVVVLPGRM